MNLSKGFGLFIFLFILNSALGQTTNIWQADLGNGQFKNPIIYADYSDPDVIRVGDDYYMTASSFNCMPGLPILHSKDLVNWQIVNYALRELKLPGAPVNFFNKPQHGKGIWAPCIRHHNGAYMIYWGDPDFGIYVVKTKNILGAWEKPVLVLPGKGRIDPSPLFDDDGKVYLVHAWAGSRARLNSIMTLCELNEDGTKVISNESLIFDGNDGVNHTVEGGKFYKKDDWYYLLAPAGGVVNGWQIALRSKNIYGPYEVTRILDQGTTNINGPHQGGLVQTQTGEWWFLHFQDKGVYGRVIHLQPVHWKDGWPVVGINEKNYCGEPVLTYKKPKVGNAYPVEVPATSDEFNSHYLGLQWSWHANPQQSWGYPSGNGYLRMYGQYYPDEYYNFWNIPNLLMQKLPAPAFTATMKSAIVLQNEGDMAGLIMMGWDYSFIALKKTKSGYEVIQNTCVDAEQKGKEIEAGNVALTSFKPVVKYNYETKLEWSDIFLRMVVEDEGLCHFYFSLDGKRFEKIGKAFQAKQGKWIGAKMGMFILNKNADSPRSWMDVDWFRVSK